MIATALLLAMVLLAALIDLRTRKIPEALCVLGMFAALVLTLLAPQSRLRDWPGVVLHVSAPSLPLPASNGAAGLIIAHLATAAIVLFVQPGMVVQFRRGARATIAVWAVSVWRRGALWVAVPMGVSAAVVTTSAWLIGGQTWQAAMAALLGAACGLMAFGLPHLIGRIAFPSHALGSGDVLLLATVGMFTGWQPLVPIVGLTLAGVVITAIVFRGIGRNAFPCGPFIALATAITVLSWDWMWPTLSVYCTPPWIVAGIWAVAVVLLAGFSLTALPERFTDSHVRGARLVAAGCAVVAIQLPAGLFAASQWSPAGAVPQGPALPVNWIARAGGAVAIEAKNADSKHLIGGSNSLEALEQNYSRGVRWFELDFSLTTDGHVVAIADWQRDSVEWLGEKPPGRRLSRNEFTAAKMEFGLTPLTFESLLAWMQEHRDTVILMDTTENLSTFLADDQMNRLSQDEMQRLIPIARTLDDGRLARDAGFDRFILSLNYTRIGDYQAIGFCRDYGPTAVAAHHFRWRSGRLAGRLAAEGQPTIATSVQSEQEFAQANTDAAISDVAAWMIQDVASPISQPNPE